MSIRYLFDAHASKEGKDFDETAVRCSKTREGASYVQGCLAQQDDGEMIVYEKDGIYIELYRRVTTLFGDTDLFTRQTVKINGKQVFVQDG